MSLAPPRISAWPLTLRVPLVVALLTIVVATAVSNVVLRRLAGLQEDHLHRLSHVYLDGLSNAITTHVLRRDVWETFDILDRSRSRYGEVPAVYNVVALPDGKVLAASDPSAFPIGARLPDSFIGRFRDGRDLAIDEDLGRAWIARTLRESDVTVGRLYAELDITELLAFRRAVLLTLIGVNGALALIAAAAGYWLVRRMLRPVAVLGSHLDRARDGRIEPIPETALRPQRTEFGRLFRGYNAMAAAVAEREALRDRLAEEEKLALLGKLASGMAHEVNNPLGGLLNTVDTLRQHGDDPLARQRALNLLERGLIGIRNVVHAALVSYKGGMDPQRLTRTEVDDLRFLIKHELDRRRLDLRWSNELPDILPVNGARARQAMLNLLLNACAASPVGSAIEFDARLEDGFLRVTITDQGPGLPAGVAESLGRLADDLPRDGGGLGLWTVRRLMARLGGRIEAGPAPAGGARIRLVIPLGREGQFNAVA